MASSSAHPPRQRESRRVSSSFNTHSRHRISKIRSRSQDPMDLPERFKEEEAENVDDGTGIGGDDPLFAQQSVYGMLAATQSTTNFPSRFQQDSGSDSEGDRDGGEEKGRTSGDVQRVRSEEKAQRKSTGVEAQRTASGVRGHRKRLSEHGGKLVKSFLKPIREKADSQAPDPMTQSQFLPPPEKEEVKLASSMHSDAPVLDRKLQAMARADMDTSIALSSDPESREVGRTSSDSLKERSSKTLPQVIANIFQWEEPEDVISEYPCWYLRNVLLQGYMYITHKHICFYAYLQKKTNVTIKSGHLGKQGKHSYRYRRYWFVLKGDTFSYYQSSAEPYFPLGQVDLRYAISADLSTEQNQDAANFTITTPSRVYLYRADTPSSAKDWVKHLQKVIFRSHNDGDSVKISLPIKTVMDVEQTSVVDFAETVKLRVIADDDTYAVDEYFFTFFSSGTEALQTLQNLIEGSGAKVVQGADEDSSVPGKLPLASSSQELLPQSRPSGRHAVSQSTSTGGPAAPRSRNTHHRGSTDGPQTGADDGGNLDRRRSSESMGSRRNTSQSPPPDSMRGSTDSFVTKSEHLSSSSAFDELDNDMSASQMLTGDGVFRNPTLKAPQPRGRPNNACQQSSRESSSEPAQVQPTARRSGEKSREQRRLELARQESGGSSHTVEPGNSDLKPTDPGRLARGVTMPLQRAITVAGMVRSSSKRVSSYLSSSPKTYIDNWSAAIVGGKRHYTDTEGLAPDDSIREPEQDVDIVEDERRFRKHFGLPNSEKLLCVFFCWLHKTVPLYGKIYMSTRRFCFRSLWYGTNTKLVVSYKDIINVQKQRGFRWNYPGMVLVIRGYEELFFDFPTSGLRDDAAITVLRNLETRQAVAESMILTDEQQKDAADAAAENDLLQAARQDGHADHDSQVPRSLHQPESDDMPILFDHPSTSVLDFKPTKPMNIVCLTIGSRGDVQPYIALCKGLMAEGHQCKIATHLEFKGWVENHGIEFAEVTGDPAELMRVCVENGMFTPSFFLEVNSTFRVWLDDLLLSAWKACQGADLLIESPSAMCGIHIAEALEIPYFRAFTMPWTRTRAYPHAFAVPNSKLGGGYNYMTYTLFDNLFWQAIAGQINRWRGKTLGLGPTSLDKLQQNKVPFLYNFSPNVVPPPLDFSDWIKITGYWFLDEGDEWTPPADLAAFIQQARADKQKLVYIGFGSVTVSDSRQLMQQVVEAVLKADVRCILAKGWSDRYDSPDASAAPVALPPSIHQIRSAPHDWLFRHVDAVVHHGGAGTTGASLRAGKPTVIKPFFGDQYFFATRVEDLGVGTHLQKVTALQLGKALWIATHDARMRAKAAALGEAIRAEDGVGMAVKMIYRHLDYAKSLIKRRAGSVAAAAGDKGGGGGGAEQDVAAEEDTEENWTFVEKDNEADHHAGGGVVAAASGDPMAIPRRESEQGRRTSLRNMVTRR